MAIPCYIPKSSIHKTLDLSASPEYDPTVIVFFSISCFKSFIACIKSSFLLFFCILFCVNKFFFYKNSIICLHKSTHYDQQLAQERGGESRLPALQGPGGQIFCILPALSCFLLISVIILSQLSIILSLFP